MKPVVSDLLVAVIIVLVAWLLSRASASLLNLARRKLISRTQTQLDDVALEAAEFPLRGVILVGGLEIAISRLRFFPADWSVDIDRVFFVLYFVLVYILLYRLIGGLVNWYGREVAYKTETDLDDRFLALFRRVGLLVLSTVAIIIVLGRFGIEVSALVTTLGIGSLAIALAAQETLGDMISGFSIMLDQPFKVGDRVEVLDIDTWGDVVEIGLRSTRILTRDNRMVSVPNSVIGKGLIVNYSVPNTMYRVQTHVGVAYGTDLEMARKVMVDAIRAQDWVMKEERIEALMLEFGESALIFRVRCWIENYVETRRILDKMNSALYKALNEAGIGIPFPQRELRLASGVTPEVRVKLESGGK
ncbi:MAG: mechanosensitive ion channel family protein [Anaerolineae bacterium]